MNNRIPYNPSIIEPKWQKKWKDSKIYNVDLDSKNKENYFSLTMFPYPSGDLHIGHWYAFTPADSYSRFKKMKGFNVLHTQGFDVAQFYIDFEGHPEEKSVKLAIEEMKFFCKKINILGVYKMSDFREK